MDKHHRRRGPLNPFIIRPAMTNRSKQELGVVFCVAGNSDESGYAAHNDAPQAAKILQTLKLGFRQGA